jgi:membrane-associated progesterone receptor component
MIVRFFLLLLGFFPVDSFVIISESKPHDPFTKLHSMSDVVGVGTCALVLVGGAVWMSGSEERAKRAKYNECEKLDQVRKQERARLAYLASREEPWTKDELKAYDGTRDPDGPILIAVAGKVYNVWKGRHFYGPGGEYSIFAGRDATRLLAKFRTTEEDEESLSIPLTMGERATLEGYVWTFKDKYDVVGTLAGYDPKDTTMW